MTEPERYKNVAEEEIEIDLRHLLKVFKKWNKLIILGTLLCAFSVGILSFFVIPPVYEAETLLMVTQATDKLQSVQQVEGLDEVVGSISQMPVWTMNTYLGQIKSEVVMQRVIDRLKMDHTLYNPATLSRQVDASIVKDSNLLDIKVSNGDPVLASKIANTLSEEYLQLMTEKNKQQMTRSMTFLEEQQSIAEEELQKSEAELKKFQSQPRGVEILQSEFENTSKDLVEFTSRLKMNQVEIRQLMAGVGSLEAELAEVPQMVSTGKWDQTSGTNVATQEMNPLYVSLSEQLAEKRAALAEKQGESEGLQLMVDSMNQEMDSLQADLAEKKVEQEKLQREVERLKQTSETLAQKATEAQIAKSIDIGDTSVMVISQASVPDHPVKPQKKLNIAIALVLGLMIFTLLAFVLDYLDNTLKTPEDITRELDLPVLGMIPLANGHNTRTK